MRSLEAIAFVSTGLAVDSLGNTMVRLGLSVLQQGKEDSSNCYLKQQRKVDW